MSKLKNTSLAIGAGTPKPIGAYGSAARPAASPTVVPRDSGGLANGETGGNFDLGGMSKLPNNSTVSATQDGQAASQAAQAENGK